MKKLSLYYVAAFLFVLSFSSCLKDDCTQTNEFVRYDPVYVSESNIHASIQNGDVREIENPGKIYYYKHYLLVNDLYKGIHVYDNIEPSSPTKVAFWDIPGNVDMSVKDNALYVDSYFDLLTIDIDDIQNISLKSRVEFGIKENSSWNGRYLVYYQKNPAIEKFDCSENRDFFLDGDIFFLNNNIDFFDAEGGIVPTGTVNSTVSGGVGQGGSLARFSIAKDRLYIINNYELSSYDVTDACNPVFKNKTNVGWNIETLFPYEDNLFIGANDGMYIFDITDPDNPVFNAQFRHSRACDPVVVTGNTAYVTLRDGTTCQNFINQLDVVDITDLYNPKLIASYEMTHPIGMAVIDNTLYLCDDQDGLKVFDTTDKKNVDKNQITNDKSINAIDAIALNGELLMVIGNDGVHQYNIKDKNKLNHLSTIQIQ